MQGDEQERAGLGDRLDWPTRMAMQAAARLGLRVEDATRPSIEARAAELCRQLDPADPDDRDRIIEIEEARRWALDLHWRLRLCRERQTSGSVEPFG